MSKVNCQICSCVVAAKKMETVHYPNGDYDMCDRCFRKLREDENLIWVDEAIGSCWIKGWVYPRESSSKCYARWARKHLSYREVAEDVLEYITQAISEKDDPALFDAEAMSFVAALGAQHPMVDHLICLSPSLRDAYEMRQYPFDRN